MIEKNFLPSATILPKKTSSSGKKKEQKLKKKAPATALLTMPIRKNNLRCQLQISQILSKKEEL